MTLRHLAVATLLIVVWAIFAWLLIRAINNSTRED